MAERELGSALPAALRDYHLACGGEQRLNRAHNRVFEPSELALADGRIVFCEENQGAVVWGCRPMGDNPEVEQGVVLASADELEWYAQDQRTAPFLELMMYLQCAWGGYEHHAVHHDPDALWPLLDSAWELVVDHDGLRIWARPGVLLSKLETDPFVLGAARTERELEWLCEQLGFEPQ